MSDAFDEPYPREGVDAGFNLRCLCGSQHFHALVNYDAASFAPTGVGQPDRCAKCDRPADHGPQFDPRMSPRED